MFRANQVFLHKFRGGWGYQKSFNMADPHIQQYQTVNNKLRYEKLACETYIPNISWNHLALFFKILFSTVIIILPFIKVICLDKIILNRCCLWSFWCTNGFQLCCYRPYRCSLTSRRIINSDRDGGESSLVKDILILNITNFEHNEALVEIIWTN